MDPTNFIAGCRILLQSHPPTMNNDTEVLLIEFCFSRYMLCVLFCGYHYQIRMV